MDGAKKSSCPLCGKPSAVPYRPFCSERCKQLDLGNWFNESYRVPVVETDDFGAEDEDEYPEG
ncbi:MAG: DNA gyrase inhibitor YacG [Rhodospirillales bacterium]|nr:DNA gyrase inhibitor YacG [Rhodospirillales bacterium]